MNTHWSIFVSGLIFYIIGIVGINNGNYIPLCKINPTYETSSESLVLVNNNFSFTPHLSYYEALSKFDENEELSRSFYASKEGQGVLAVEHCAHKIC